MSDSKRQNEEMGLGIDKITMTSINGRSSSEQFVVHGYIK
jgi:hypothetical protein